jgi:hypothetical protein
MSPQGCLSAFFVGIILAWSLFIGAFITAGWLGAEIIEFVTAIFFADAAGARRASESVIQFLRALGFGVFAAIWGLGTAVLALLWFAALRGARTPAGTTSRTRIDIEMANIPPTHEMKDVTPRTDGRGGPPEILPPR